MNQDQNKRGLHEPLLESDACGIGLITNFRNKSSFKLVDSALVMLENMSHRGAVGVDKNTGDGAGILIQIPFELYLSKAKHHEFDLPEPYQYGSGICFFSEDDFNASLEVLKEEIAASNFEILAFIDVECNSNILGISSGQSEPIIKQLFVRPKLFVSEEKLETDLFLLRKTIAKAWQQKGISDVGAHICSLSCRTIVYKGYLTSGQLRHYFKDLTDPMIKSSLALVHSRFSTNTSPQWHLAQPFRLLAHNGEINTIQGNLNSWKARENEISITNPRLANRLFPITDDTLSDSGNLDRVVEFFIRQGKTLPEIMMMLIPEAYQNDKMIPSFKKDFYEFNEYVIEPWEGPASLVFTDGKLVGACLDRNGLRPSRYYITNDDTLVLASEAGALALPNDEIVKKGRLQPGKMLVADLEEERIVTDVELKRTICKRINYSALLEECRQSINLVKANHDLEQSELKLLTRQLSFGYTKEDLDLIIATQALTAKEPIGAMGCDVPLAVLSEFAQPIYNYFKQQFAQVTNPPIDPLREDFYMSLECSLGKIKNIFNVEPEAQRIFRLSSPVLKRKSYKRVYQLEESVEISTVYNYNSEECLLESAIEEICSLALKWIERGKSILCLSDILIDEHKLAVPSLLICGALHHFLIKRGLRKDVSIVLRSSDTLETHHIACLLSFGADAIYPELAIESAMAVGTESNAFKSESNYIKALEKGLLKIISKLGIATINSYKGAQTFEILGLSDEIVAKCFPGTISRIGGMTFEMLERELIKKHDLAFVFDLERLEDIGQYSWRSNGEYHLFNPKSIHLLRNACRLDRYDLFESFTNEIDSVDEGACTLRSLLEIHSDRKSIDIEDVEPIEDILKRFATGAMSFGSLSHEAHSTLAIAMNRIGAKSNSGEGGEDPSRYVPLENGDSMSSAIKQIASGRFGVTAEYLLNAKELQIKIAQGAKPGEGGQLPGHKVDEWIARVRHAAPGTDLISPPPHHDIYSIEDLAQLIFDLKNANPQARISVKLVSKAGVGIIASGVTKAKAEHILISGSDGGTGASPLSSIKHAGIPWELGLSEAQQVLVQNDLRDKVVLQCDGQLRTPKDMILASLLGAEEWGISTAALVVEGCILLRKCHLNTCSVGIATQDPELRKNFDGKVEDIVRYFTFLAEGIRKQLAKMGYTSINEIVGRADLLNKRKEKLHWKAASVDLSRLLFYVSDLEQSKRYCSSSQDFGLDQVLDNLLIEKSQLAIEKASSFQSSLTVKNTDRSVGSLLSHFITKKYGADGLNPGSIHFRLRGSAGQSFGAFTNKGISFTIEGEANDYFGKGLSGARLVIVPDRFFIGNPQQNVIVGNVALYGATSGEVYINGKAGERFCVRNSGADVVVESIGDNGCEYMTGGYVVVLGNIGRNFGAGMSGGCAYIYSPNDFVSENLNTQMVSSSFPEGDDFDKIYSLLSKHFYHTASKKALAILHDWDDKKKGFLKIHPQSKTISKENSYAFIPQKIIV